MNHGPSDLSDHHDIACHQSINVILLPLFFLYASTTRRFPLFTTVFYFTQTPLASPWLPSHLLPPPLLFAQCMTGTHSLLIPPHPSSPPLPIISLLFLENFTTVFYFTQTPLASPWLPSHLLPPPLLFAQCMTGTHSLLIPPHPSSPPLPIISLLFLENFTTVFYFTQTPLASPWLPSHLLPPPLLFAQCMTGTHSLLIPPHPSSSLLAAITYSAPLYKKLWR